MKIITLKWNDVAGIILLAAVLVLLFLAMSWAVTQLMASVGWHALASVGWVATPV
jgi:hypothetical protein